MFPRHLDRSVLDSCVNPDWTWREQFLWQGDAVQRNVDQWAQWTSRRNGHFGLGIESAEVLGVVEEVVAALETQHDSPHLRTLFDGAVGTQATNRGKWAELGTLVAELHAAIIFRSEGDGNATGYLRQRWGARRRPIARRAALLLAGGRRSNQELISAAG